MEGCAMDTKYTLRWVLVVGIALVGLLAFWTGLRVEERTLAAPASPTPQSSFLFRFDPASQAFYTYPLPMGSTPYGVAVTGTDPTHVWVAEYGRDRIGHLVYTDTNHVAWIEYPVTSTANSGPFRLALDGNSVWFTERGANRIGRLDGAAGEIVEFYDNGLAPNSGLADIAVSPDGWVWAAGQTSNRLVRLVVTPTVDYAFHEYTHTLLTGPFGLVVAVEPSTAPSYDVWFTSPASQFYKAGRLSPALEPNPFLFPQSFLTDSVLYEVVFTPGYVWFSDSGHNAIDQIVIGTYSIVNPYGSVN